MNHEWINWILDWIRLHPAWAGWLIAIVAFLEGLAIFGLLIPGALILFSVGALIAVGAIDLTTAWIACSVGAALGDGLSYWFGLHYQDNIREKWPFNRYRDLVKNGESYFLKHGGKSVFIGRFVGPIRSIIPVIAGMMGMRPIKYIPINIFASILWSPFYILPGIAFGASLELAAAVAGKLVGLLLMLVLVIWANYWLISRTYRFLAPRTVRMMSSCHKWVQKHPRLGKYAGALIDPEQPESGSLLFMAILLILATWLFFSLLLMETTQGAWISWDQQLWQGFAQFRHPWADDIARVWVAVSESQTTSWFALSMAMILFWMKGPRAAVHVILAAAFALAVGFLLEQWVQVPVPIGANPDAFGFPSIEMTLATAVYGLFAIVLAREMPVSNRIWPYLFFGLLIVLAGFARLYLGLHWFSDMLAGVFLGLVWATILGIAYRQHTREHFRYKSLIAMSLLFITAFSSISFWLNHQFEDTLHANSELRTLVEQDPEVIEHQPLAPGMDFRLYASLSEIQQILHAGDWYDGPEMDLTSLFQWLSPEAQLPDIPIAARTVSGQLPSLELRKNHDAKQGWLFRVWPDPINAPFHDIQPDKKIYWQASIQRIRVRNFWLVFRMLEPEPAELEQKNRLQSSLEESIKPSTAF